MLNVSTKPDTVLPMTKADAKIEVDKLMAELNQIEAQSETEKATAKFLFEQVERLALEGRNVATTEERKEQIIKEMENLRKRMEYEERHIPDVFPRMEKIVVRLKEIMHLADTGQLT